MRRRRRRDNERGAILVLTCIAMIAMMGFTAAAIDLGQRNQQLARAQHAIDASVLSAAQYLSAHDGDFAGAVARVKELIRQNLGIDPGAWNTCTDDDHLEVTVAASTECISFRRIAATATTGVKNDIRVKLPDFKMNTIFGSVLGVDTIDLAAAAASNGNNCGGSPACSPGTTEVPSSTEPPPTTTPKEYCAQFNALQFAIYDDLWKQCADFNPDFDRTWWQDYACNNTQVTFEYQGQKITWEFDELNRYFWYWSICANYVSVTDRDSWLTSFCFAKDVTPIYWNYTYWYECASRRPSLQDWDQYFATTTTWPPDTTPETTTTEVATPSSVPSSIDLSN